MPCFNLTGLDVDTWDDIYNWIFQGWPVISPLTVVERADVQGAAEAAAGVGDR